MRKEFIDELKILAKSDDRIILISGDLGYGVVDEFKVEFPHRYLNVGINEQSMLGVAAGFARNGFRPFVYSIANFPTFRALEQIRNDINYMNLPVSIISVGAGLSYGTAGYTHHLVEDISIMRIFENIKIFSPADEKEARILLRDSLNYNNPAYFRLGKGGEPVFKSTKILKEEGFSCFKEGQHGSIIFTGGIADEVIEATEILNNMGIFPSVYSVSKIDKNLIEKILDILPRNFILTVEEHVLAGGFGSFLCEAGISRKDNIKIKNLGIKSINIEISGSQKFLRKEFGIDANSIAKEYESLYLQD